MILVNVMYFSAIKIPVAFNSSSFDNNDRDNLLSPSATHGLDSGEFLYQIPFFDHGYNLHRVTQENTFYTLNEIYIR